MRRTWFIAAVVVGVAAIVVAAAIGRTRDKDPAQPTATEWANSVCTDLATWKSSITSIASVSGGTLTRDSLTQKLEDGQKATKELVNDLKALGPPDLEAGDQLKQQLDSSSAALQSSYDELSSSAQQALDASSPVAFIQALAKLAPKLGALLDQVATTITDLQNGNYAADAKSELEQAFNDASACQSLRNG